LTAKLDMFDLGGHVAVVTGGNGGIGLAMAKGLAKAGASVAIWGRNADKNVAAVDALCGLECDAEAFVCDVAEEEEIVAAMQATLERFGRVDSCFANAGMGRAKPFLDMTVDDWDAVMRVNLIGASLVFREALRHIVARGGGGKLVAIASVGSIHGMPRQENYAASKAGLTALIRSLAVEFARFDVQANAILPGWIDTDLRRRSGRSSPPRSCSERHCVAGASRKTSKESPSTSPRLPRGSIRAT
jgi:NAD(P)-dependent dehydrogenase (short-subunit alcohol dehydrogenase family)